MEYQATARPTALTRRTRTETAAAVIDLVTGTSDLVRGSLAEQLAEPVAGLVRERGGGGTTVTTTVTVETPPERDAARYLVMGKVHGIMSLEFSRLLPRYCLTEIQRCVWDLMYGNQRYDTEDFTQAGIIQITQVKIAEELNTHQPNVSQAIKRLSALGFIIRVKQGVYRVHPCLAYCGSAETQARLIAWMREQNGGELPPIQAPAYNKRPKAIRRNTKQLALV